MNYKQEVGVGIFFFILAMLYLAGSLLIPKIDPFGNSPLSSRAIPQLIGGMIAILSVIHVSGNVLKMKKANRDGPSSEKTAGEAETTGGQGAANAARSGHLMLFSVLFICAYIFLFTRLGFIVSTVLFLLVEIFLLIPAEKRKRWAAFIICFSVALPVLLYLLFTKPLSMFLPRGLIG
jgi:hypothetical protein